LLNSIVSIAMSASEDSMGLYSEAIVEDIHYSLGSSPANSVVADEDSNMEESQDSLDSASSRSSAATVLLADFSFTRHLDITVVFDMDYTLVGDLQALSDRDNLERNLQWPVWPSNSSRGLTSEQIACYLRRGMLRPGFADLVRVLLSRGVQIMVYTHSEERWASRVLKAVESVIGVNFISFLFSRRDCRDHHPHFAARKSLRHVINHTSPDIRLDRMIMFDDDQNALGGDEKQQLVVVPAYQYWEKCPYDEILTKEFVSAAPPAVARCFYQSLCAWGIAPPSFGATTRTEAMAAQDLRWAEAQQRKESMRLSMNPVELRDNLMQRMASVFDGYSVESSPKSRRPSVFSRCGSAPSVLQLDGSDFSVARSSPSCIKDLIMSLKAVAAGKEPMQFNQPMASPFEAFIPSAV